MYGVLYKSHWYGTIATGRGFVLDPNPREPVRTSNMTYIVGSTGIALWYIWYGIVWWLVLYNTILYIPCRTIQYHTIHSVYIP